MAFRRNLIRALMEPGGVELPDVVWKRMNESWIVFFAALGVLNLLVAFNFSRTTWVTFKSFGLTVLTLVFALAQGLLISRFLDRAESGAEPRADASGASRASAATDEAA